MFLSKLIKMKFFSPIIFQHNYIEIPWRITSDYLIRALTYAYSKLYDVNEWFKLLEDDTLRISSLLLIYRDALYLPDYGVKSYVSLDGDIIDTTEIITTVSRVRMPRVEEVDPTPFEDYQLLAPKYEWGMILTVHSDYYGKVFHKVMASLRLLGNLGLGARESRGGGRFKIMQVDDPRNYGMNVLVAGMNKLISRYVNREKDLKIKVARKLYVERTRVYYGEDKFKEFPVIAEGSELKIDDNGLLEYFKNDLLHDVPLYYRPLAVTIS